MGAPNAAKLFGPERHLTLSAKVKESSGNIILLPENALGALTPTVKRLWQRELAGTNKTILAGATIIKPEGYDNALVQITQHGTEILYNQRMPIPIAMWKPWNSNSASARPFGPTSITIKDKTYAPLICHEQLLVWPILFSMAENPTAILAISNVWWAKNTNIPQIQHTTLTAWSRLFGIPLIAAENQ